MIKRVGWYCVFSRKSFERKSLSGRFSARQFIVRCGTSDFLDLFRQPQLWSSARPKISVLKLGPQQVDGRRRATKNSFDELSTVGAFRMLRSWDIRLAIEAPAIKKWDCSGKRASRYTLEMIRNVEGAGGKVDLLSLDEPLSAALRACDDTLEGAANKTADYRRAMAWITKVHIAIGAPDDAVFQSGYFVRRRDVPRLIQNAQLRSWCAARRIRLLRRSQRASQYSRRESSHI